MKQLLPNKVAIITGGGSGMGRASALLFAEEGAKVVVADWNMEGAESVAAEIKAAGGDALAIKIDVSKEAEIKKMVDATMKAYGRVDILYNNAAIGYTKLVDARNLVDTSEEAWDYVQAVNLKGTAMGCKHVLPIMVEQGGGVIINAGSGNALHSAPGLDAYTASKGGVVSLTRVLADVYGKHGIRVHCLCPGAVNTPMIAGQDGPGGPVEYWKSYVPLRRLGEPEEVASVALFLASDMSSYVTGGVINADGGRCCK